MKFSIPNTILLPVVSTLCSIVERKQTLASLSMILIEPAAGGGCVLTATDHQIEMKWLLADVSIEESSAVLVSAHKLLDACRNSSQEAMVHLQSSEKNVKVKIEKRNYLLNTVSTEEFPKLDISKDVEELNLRTSDMKLLMEKVSFAMAQNDARHYLNGVLFIVSPQEIATVATDGHRLAICQLPGEKSKEEKKIILPRKAVLELQKLFDHEDENLVIKITERYANIVYQNLTITVQLIEGDYPDYQRVIPKTFTETVKINTTTFRQTIEAACIVVLDEPVQNIQLNFTSGKLLVTTTNKDGEKAEVEQEVEYAGEGFQIGFNAQYLLDVLTASESEYIIFEIKDNNSGAQICDENIKTTKNIIMPMRT